MPAALHFRERLDQVPPRCRQRYHFVSSQPSQPARSFSLRLGPPCYAVRRHELGDNTAPLQFGCNRCPELRVPFRPRSQVIAGRKPIAFLAIACTIGEYEVVAQGHRIPSPSDEVINVGGRWRKRCLTVEAPTQLDIEQDGAYDGQSRSLTTEEELVQIGRFTEHWRNNRPHAPAHQVGDQRVELAEAERDAGTKYDDVTGTARVPLRKSNLIRFG